MRPRAALGALGAVPVLAAGLPAVPGRFHPFEVVGHVAAIAIAVWLTDRRPALGMAIAIAAWEVVFLSRVQTNSLVAASVLAVGLVVVCLLAGRSDAAGHREVVVLVLGPAAGAVAALVATGELDRAVGAAIGAAVLSTVPWTVGRYRRQHLAMVRAGWDRAARWERAADHARTHERARLAGEMHDLVGHELAKAALQIGALEVDPSLDERHRGAAGAARAAVTAAAERLADAVRMLRADDDDADADVPELVTRSAEAGLDVTLVAEELHGHDPVVATTLRRVVAEALTNAMKHAPGAPVRVVVGEGDRGPRVAVYSGPSAGSGLSATGTGLGLAGLHERVRLLGGSFRAGPEPDGGFAVIADLPRRPAMPAEFTPTATDVERRRAQERVRRSGRRAVLAAVLVASAAVAVAVAYMWFDAATSVLSPADAARITVGEPVAEVEPLLPDRTRIDHPEGVPPEPAGATCRYYSVLPTPPAPPACHPPCPADPFGPHGSDLHRLCFRDGRVVMIDRIDRTDAGRIP